jgi:hypothetical protein
MFLNYFKSSFFNQYLTIFIIGSLLWAGAIFRPVQMPEPEGPVPFYEWVYSMLQAYPSTASILAFFLLLFEAWFVTTIFSRHELVPKNSSVSALIFILFMSLHPVMMTITPATIALLLQLIILYHLLIYYNKPEHLDRVYIAGFFTALAGLFDTALNLWFVFILVALVVIRAANWRAWLAAFTGFLTPLIYVAAYAFWVDRFPELYRMYVAFFSNPSVLPFIIPPGFLTVAIPALLLIGVAWMTPVTASDKAVETRAKSNVVYWIFFFTIATIPFQGNYDISHFLLALPVISLLISRTLLGLKRQRMAEIMMLIYFFLTLGNNLWLSLL